MAKLRKVSENVKPHKPEVEFKLKSKPVKSDERCYNFGGNNNKGFNYKNNAKGPLCFRCNIYVPKSFEYNKTKVVKLPNEHSQVNMITIYFNLIQAPFIKFDFIGRYG